MLPGVRQKANNSRLFIDDQVQLEAVEPASRSLAACSPGSLDPMLGKARIATDGQKRGRINEADAGTAAQLGVQLGHQGNQQHRHQRDETLIAHLDGKLPAQVALDVLSVIGASTCGSGTDGTGS
jgi:hypothetical protein